MKYNRSEIFKAAWKMVKEFGIAFGAALRMAWAKAKKALTVSGKIEALINAGAKRWTKNGMDRLYINADVLGYTYETYKTGNISDAYLNGERISNSEMYRVRGAKVYVDCADLSIHCDYSKLVPQVEAFVASAM